jgi:hypothetical protein
MVEFNERTQANMDVVLEEICIELPHGGDLESRNFIAEQLIQCAGSGRTTLGELMYTARRAIISIATEPAFGLKPSCLKNRAFGNAGPRSAFFLWKIRGSEP